ncbi:protein AmbD [Amorphoplanes auranticolor]|uniref:Protein AmbD n=1 Tax=Actinoplanes auranticolor TaxID=47988 RepID=A0A919VV47_9ACTN|nr:protein AmbD [Actinoplanes auranticolor]
MSPRTETENHLPAVVRADGPDHGRQDLLSAQRTEFPEQLVPHGAVLFRGFAVGGVPGMDAAVRALSGDLPAYEERSSPRSTIEGRVYTSTDYPGGRGDLPAQRELLPGRLAADTVLLLCQSAGHAGRHAAGRHPRGVRRIDPAVREEFARRRWMVVRNFHPRVGAAWQQAFNTDDKSRVEAYCAQAGLRAQWHGDALRTTAVRDAVHTHPDTGEPVWFNHATFFHVTSRHDAGAGHPRGAARALRRGGPADEHVLRRRRPDPRGCDGSSALLLSGGDGALRLAARRPLVVDNMTAAHGREPFTGPRRIAVAIAEPHRGGRPWSR